MSLSIDLRRKKVLIVGIANENSIAYGCAKRLRKAGASLAITYLNQQAEPYVRPLAERLGADLICRLDVQQESEMKALFAMLSEYWEGSMDGVLHSVAFAPKQDLHGRVTDSSSEGFAKAMDISCHSFIRMARLAEPLLKQAGGGSLLTVSYMGSERVVGSYGMMGPVKAALEASVRYLAAELGESGIRVNALSPGAIATRAASGIKAFDRMLKEGVEKSPLRRGVTQDDVGNLAAFLYSDLARNITGEVHYVDAGYEIID